MLSIRARVIQNVNIFENYKRVYRARMDCQIEHSNNIFYTRARKLFRIRFFFFFVLRARVLIGTINYIEMLNVKRYNIVLIIRRQLSLDPGQNNNSLPFHNDNSY